MCAGSLAGLASFGGGDSLQVADGAGRRPFGAARALASSVPPPLQERGRTGAPKMSRAIRDSCALLKFASFAALAIGAVAAVSTAGDSTTSAATSESLVPFSPALGAGFVSSIDRSADALAVAERGASVQLFPPPPPEYPSGVCDSLATGLPGLAGSRPQQLRQIGTSLLGRPIWAEYWGPSAPSALVVIVGQVHGDECSPTLLSDEVRSRPPTRRGIWLIPTLNPDGYAAYERRNANQVDLNADGGSRSQPETNALMVFIADVRPELIVHLHSPNGFAGGYAPHGGGLAAGLCQSIAASTAIRCSDGGAGTRSDTTRWFLWQGHAQQGGETLLVELHAVSDSEVPTARPRPATRSVNQVRADARVIVSLLDGP